MNEIEEAQKWMTEKWADREAHPRWIQANALTLCAKLRRPASQAGWLLGLYGSVLDQPTAGDLDLILVNWRDKASKLAVIKWVRMNYEAKVVDIYSGSFGVGVGMCTEAGYLIDLHFRITPVVGRTIWEEMLEVQT